MYYNRLPVLSLVFCGLTLNAAAQSPASKWKPAIRVSSGLPKSKKWDRDMAAHLLRRAGFGGAPEQIDDLAGLGRERAVESLLCFDEVTDEVRPLDIQPTPRPDPRRRGTPEFEKQFAQRMRHEQTLLREVLGEWLERMATSPRPLQEKLVLFWHGHFTSGFREVKSAQALYVQNELFRTHAAGNFRELALAVTFDPAMILYLNSQQNRRGNPNENYARELMELFTLGTGHYTEQDVKEAARALTGLMIDPETRTGRLEPRRHDDGIKTILGRTGRFGPPDVIDLVLSQPAAAEFLARKFWTFFAYENPEERIVRALAKVLRDHRYELKPFLKAMFTCDAFYGERARFTHVKSPVELVIGTIRMLDLPPADTDLMNQALRGMGQQLLQPPNVKGWDGGLAWITTSTLYNRYNLVARLIDGNDNEQTRRIRKRQSEWLRETLGNEATRMSDDDLPRLQPAFDPLPILQAGELRAAEQIVDYFIDRLLQRPLAEDHHARIIQAFREDWDRATDEAARAESVRGLLKLLVSTPEYQLS